MPRIPVKYQNTVIYKIVCNDLSVKKFFVSSTTEFVKRKAYHKFNCMNVKSKKYNNDIYKFIRENGGWSNWTMIWVEKYPCENGNMAKQREAYWYDRLAHSEHREGHDEKEKNDELIRRVIDIYNSLNDENKKKLSIDEAIAGIVV